MVQYKGVLHPFIDTEMFLILSFEIHPAESKWMEFNAHVKHPIGRELNSMVNEDLLNMDDDMIKFFVSWFASRVPDIGI